VIVRRTAPFNKPGAGGSSPHNGGSSPHSAGDSSPSSPDSGPLEDDSSPLQAKGQESGAEGQELLRIAAPIARKGKVSKAAMEAVVLDICRGRHLSLGDLSRLLARKPESLRNKTLTPMIRDGRLRYRYPDTPNRPDQAYTTAEEAS
jgi:ATP-dependent DNA helicase RecG